MGVEDLGKSLPKNENPLRRFDTLLPPPPRFPLEILLCITLCHMLVKPHIISHIPLFEHPPPTTILVRKICFPCLQILWTPSPVINNKQSIIAHPITLLHRSIIFFKNTCFHTPDCNSITEVPAIVPEVRTDFYISCYEIATKKKKEIMSFIYICCPSLSWQQNNVMVCVDTRNLAVTCTQDLTI